MLSTGSGGSDFGVEGNVIDGVTVVEESIIPGKGSVIGPSQPNSSASQCKNNYPRKPNSSVGVSLPLPFFSKTKRTYPIQNILNF